jgi:catechol 2,3-dioxygenase-like lactoylglutathione lyase family enzyme
MLRNSDPIAFVPTRDPKKARPFYEQTLGLEFVSEDPFVSTVVDFRPQPFTIFGWRVASAEQAVRALADRGVQFERFPGMNQDGLGIWQSPSGAKVAWFKDPDGNVLSVTET